YTPFTEYIPIYISPISPNRGLIFDRNGVVLAQNYTAYTLEIVPDQVENLEATISQLATLIDITPEDLSRFKKLRRENTRFKSIPIRSRLTDIEVARFAENRFRFSGVEVKARLLRHYPEGESASHFIGYINRINDADLKQLSENSQLDNYRGTLHIGRSGIEKSYENDLHGMTGVEQVETDAVGRPVRTLSRAPPLADSDTTLNIDIPHP